jgi:O-antigen ligase
MPPRLALGLACAFIAWLFAGEKKRGDAFAGALWVPLLWLLILGSRPVSLWFNNGQTIDPDAYQEGSPFDRNVFLALILCGGFILSRRSIRWSELFKANRWLVVYFLYLGISVSWSDNSFVSFKRWFKDVGNLIMALVILTEQDPVRALRSVLVRAAYILIPLSVVLIKYFPDLGRYYNAWIWTYSYCGVSQNKNLLGSVLIVCTLGLFWHFLASRAEGRSTKPLWIFLPLLVWLFSKASSSTAVGCSVLGCAIVLAMRLPVMRQRVRAFALSAVCLLAGLYLLDSIFNLREVAVVDVLGRDMTLTGRTVIWKRVLQVNINPLLGVGYYSFWMGKRIDWVAEGWLGQFNESHNGYIETYLNTGLIGLALLIAVSVSSLRRLAMEVVAGGDAAAMRFALLVIVLIYNITEAAFNRLSPLWVLMLVVIVNCPALHASNHLTDTEQTPG